jgi:hypothetical protein
MIASNLGGGMEVSPVTVPLNLKTENTASQVAPSQKKESQEKIENLMTVEEYVRGYFSDIPVMIEIAKCESRFRQYDKNGEVLRGVVNSLDRGVMQINEYYHLETAEKLGYDLLTIEGNTAYARYIYEKSGVKPWVSSSPCWGKTTAYSEYKDLALK